MVIVRWEVRCANGERHRHELVDGTPITASCRERAEDCAAFMDEPREDSPWSCGPHSAAEVSR